MARSIVNSGSCISSNRSFATWAIHSLKGSALGDGMDWDKPEQLFCRSYVGFVYFPSVEGNFSWLQFVTDSFPSFLSLCFSTFQ